MKMSGVSLKRNVNQKFHRMLREPCTDCLPSKNKFEYGKNSKKNKQYNPLHLYLPAVDFEVWNDPFHETMAWMTKCIISNFRNYFSIQMKSFVD